MDFEYLHSGVRCQFICSCPLVRLNRRMIGIAILTLAVNAVAGLITEKITCTPEPFGQLLSPENRGHLFALRIPSPSSMPLGHGRHASGMRERYSMAGQLFPHRCPKGLPHG